MKVWSRLVALVIPFAMLIFLCGFTANPTLQPGAPVIVTASPSYQPLAALRGEERFPLGAHLLMVRDGVAQPLVPDFFASADASVSFDASHVTFAGRERANDPWQVWELTLSDRSVRRVTATQTDAIRPLYLPDDRIVYAQRGSLGFQLEAASIDGSAVLPLTYLNGSAIPANVLHDGRILFESTFPIGSGESPEMYLVYSDGSGVESYRCDHSEASKQGRWGGRQLATGDVVFTHGKSLAKFTSPLATEIAITAPPAQYAGDVVETAEGTWLLSVRSNVGRRYTLVTWKPGTKSLQTILAMDGIDLVQAVLVAARTKPNRHPTALHDWTTANLLALDARQSRDGVFDALPVTVRTEMKDANGTAVTLGTAPVEADGSFFVKVPGDKPIRFALLDAKGVVIREEHGWFWARRGEQRICVGCHVGPERSPENTVPKVLLRSTTPVDLSGPVQITATGGH